MLNVDINLHKGSAQMRDKITEEIKQQIEQHGSSYKPYTVCISLKKKCIQLAIHLKSADQIEKLTSELRNGSLVRLLLSTCQLEKDDLNDMTLCMSYSSNQKAKIEHFLAAGKYFSDIYKYIF